MPVQVRGGEDEWDGEVLVCLVLPDQLPRQLGHERAQQVCGLRLPQQENRGSRQTAPRLESHVGQELVVIPGVDFISGDTRRVPLGEGLPRDGEGLGGEIVDARIFQRLPRPIKRGALLTYGILLFESEGLKGFARPRVEMPLPGYRHSLRSGRNFEDDDAAVGVIDYANASERKARLGAVGHLLLEGVQPRRLLPVVGSDYASGAVSHAEHKPAGIAAA